MDTAVVSYGPVAEVEQRTGIVRKESTPVSFGAIAALFDSFYVQHGEEVAYGQLLARLDMTHLAKEIENLEERIAQMRIDFNFQNDLSAINMEIQGHSASYIRLEQELARELQALTLRHLEGDLENLKTRYAQSELYAPFDGIIVYISDYIYGDWVTPFSNMLHIAPKDATVFVDYTGQSIHTTSTTRIRAHIDGKVYNVYRIPITSEQIIRYDSPPVRFAFETDTPPPLGAFVSLHVYSRWVDDVLRLPRNVLFNNPDIGTYVYRVVNGQREMVLVSVGMRTATYIEILGGLYEGDVVYVRS